MRAAGTKNHGVGISFRRGVRCRYHPFLSLSESQDEKSCLCFTGVVGKPVIKGQANRGLPKQASRCGKVSENFRNSHIYMYLFAIQFLWLEGSKDPSPHLYNP